MNGYLYSRYWFDFRFENPDLCRCIHSELYLYIVDKWNRLGQKEKLGLPTEKTMEVLNIGSYNTYKKALNDLVVFGFIKVIVNSSNQHTSKVIALSKNDKASNKALDKATDEATDKATDTIIEQKNKRTKEQKNTVEENFELFWNHWFTFVKHKKEKKEPTFKKWKALSTEEQGKAFVQAEPYSQTKGPADHKFLCIARTYLNDKLFNDEMTPDSEIEQSSSSPTHKVPTPEARKAFEAKLAEARLNPQFNEARW